MILGILASAIQQINSEGGGSFKDQVLGLTPRAYYRFAEASGSTLKDSSGNGRDGVYPDDASQFTTASLIGDAADAATIFPKLDRSGSRRITVTPTPFNTGEDWTLGFVVKPTEKPTTSNDLNYVITQMTTPNTTQGGPEIGVVGDDTTYYFRIMRSGVAQLFDTSSTFRKPYGTVAICFLTYTKATNTVEMWANGIKVGSGTGTYPTYDGIMRIGWADFAVSDHYPFIGVMDELTVFAAKLSDTQIQNLTNAATPAAKDPLWAQVKSLMLLDSMNDSAGPTWSPRGAPVISSEQKLFGKNTLKLDGSSLLLSSLTGASAGIDSNVDLTIEVFFYPTRESGTGENNDYQRIVSMEGGGNLDMVIMRTNGPIYQMVMRADQQQGFMNQIGRPNFNAWNHLVLQRKAGQWQCLANGSMLANRPNYTGNMPAMPWALGGAYADGTPKEWLTGYMSNFRLTVGTARYAGTYDVPTAPFPTS